MYTTYYQQTGIDFAELVGRVFVMRSRRRASLTGNVENPGLHVSNHLNTELTPYTVFSIEGNVRDPATTTTIKDPSQFRDQILTFDIGKYEGPPPMQILLSFCSATLFWLNLDPNNNLIIHFQRSTRQIYIFLVYFLLNCRLVKNLAEAEALLGRRSYSPCFSFFKTAAPSTDRWFEFLDYILSSSARNYVPPVFCVRHIFVQDVDDAEDLTLRIYQVGVINRGVQEFLLVDENSYSTTMQTQNFVQMVFDIATNDPIVQRKRHLFCGDFCVEFRKNNRPFAHFYSNTYFLKLAGSDIFEIRANEMDFCVDSAEEVSRWQNIVVSVIIDDLQRPNSDKELVETNEFMKPCFYPLQKPTRSLSDFIKFHHIRADPDLVTQLSDELGLEKEDVQLYLILSCNNPHEAVEYSKRYRHRKAQYEDILTKAESDFEETHTYYQQLFRYYAKLAEIQSETQETSNFNYKSRTSFETLSASDSTKSSASFDKNSESFKDLSPSAVESLKTFFPESFFDTYGGGGGGILKNTPPILSEPHSTLKDDLRRVQQSQTHDKSTQTSEDQIETLEKKTTSKFEDDFTDPDETSVSWDFDKQIDVCIRILNLSQEIMLGEMHTRTGEGIQIPQSDDLQIQLRLQNILDGKLNILERRRHLSDFHKSGSRIDKRVGDDYRKTHVFHEEVPKTRVLQRVKCYKVENFQPRGGDLKSFSPK